VIADSAQFSAALTRVTEKRYIGTALTAQMAMGFLVTVVSIRLLPIVAEEIGWRWALCVLSLGPLAGVSVLRLRPRDQPPAASVLVAVPHGGEHA
jgi:apolipoprotein N-acyltransferase